MQTALPRLSHVLLALDHHLQLVANLIQPPQHFLVPIREVQDRVLDPRLRAELLDQLLQPPEVMPRHTREQVVHRLELQPPVDEVQPRGAADIHGRPELALREGLGLAELRGRHAPVGQRDLDVQRHRHNVRDEDERDADGPRGERLPQEAVPEQEPVAAHEGNLRGADPPRLAGPQTRRPVAEEVDPGQEVEVEARDTHDGVVHVLLVRDHGVGDGVPDECEVVVARAEGLEEGGAGGEERDVLDVGVVFLGLVSGDVGE